jgi:hypothetical protein
VFAIINDEQLLEDFEQRGAGFIAVKTATAHRGEYCANHKGRRAGITLHNLMKKFSLLLIFNQ